MRAEGAYVYDAHDQAYLDFYGGHAVISIGHSHPHYLQRVQEQLHRIGFYSNSIQNPLQHELAKKLLAQSGMKDYQLFLCNSGAEANENALKLASFTNKRRKILCVSGGFHGRTSLAVAATDNPKIQAAVNPTDHIVRIPHNDIQALEETLDEHFAAVILEFVQGVGGIIETSTAFAQALQKRCTETGTLLIADEVQSGYGRTGQFFAFQDYPVQPDVIAMAKGMGNGFPIGGILIRPGIEAWPGMLGTTFGGNHLSCAAGLAVLEVMEKERLLDHTKEIGAYLRQTLDKLNGFTVRGKGLMLALDFPFPIAELRKHLVYQEKVFTGSAKLPHTLRLLPPLNIGKAEVDRFVEKLGKALEHQSPGR